MGRRGTDLAKTGGCKRCNSIVTDGLRCVNCGILSHKSCLKYYKYIKYLSDDTVICCIENSTPDLTPTDSIPPLSPLPQEETADSVKIILLQEIIKQKDLVIENQKIAIRALNDQIVLLREVQSNAATNTHTGAVKKGTAHELPLASKKTIISSADVAGAIPEVKSNVAANTYAGAVKKGSALDETTPFEFPLASKKTTVSSADVAGAISNAQAQTTSKSINPNNNTPHLLAPHNRVPRKSGNILTGSSKNSSCPLKAVEKRSKKYFHLTMMSPDSNTEELQRYLQTFADSSEVKRLPSNSPQSYASFKIGVDTVEADKLMKPEIWPDKAILNHFFPSRKLVSNFT